jgi:hypothetical protein
VYAGGGICVIALVTNNKRTTAIAKHRILFFSRIRRSSLFHFYPRGALHLAERLLRRGEPVQSHMLRQAADTLLENAATTPGRFRIGMATAIFALDNTPLPLGALIEFRPVERMVASVGRRPAQFAANVLPIIRDIQAAVRNGERRWHRGRFSDMNHHAEVERRRI